MNRSDLLALTAITRVMQEEHLPEPQSVRFYSSRPAVLTVRLADYALWTRAALEPDDRQAQTLKTEHGTHYFHVGRIRDSDVTVRVATSDCAPLLTDTAGV